MIFPENKLWYPHGNTDQQNQKKMPVIAEEKNRAGPEILERAHIPQNKKQGDKNFGGPDEMSVMISPMAIV